MKYEVKKEVKEEIDDMEMVQNLGNVMQEVKQEEKEKFYKSIEEINALKIRCQRSHYDELEKLHYWKSTPAAIASSDNNDTADHHSVGKASVNSSQQTNDLHHRHVSLGDDPLSSLLQRKKSNEFESSNDIKPKEKWGGIFGNKNRDRTTKSNSISDTPPSSLARAASRWRLDLTSRVINA